jgi:hypothetical protein
LAELALPAHRLSDLALAPNTPDDELWRFCQTEGLVLVTGNRNEAGPDSLTG